MLILLTNDDGINASGLKALKDAMSELGEVWVVAPATEQSGVSHGFSLRGPLKVDEVHSDGRLFGHAVSGTPVDAVKVAVRALLPRMPDLVVSGINAGENTGVDLLYSGTVAGAMEGAMLGIPSLAFSLASRSYTDFDASAQFASKICRNVLERGLPAGLMVNVNVPPFPLDQIKGVRITRQGNSFYEEALERREEPGGVKYYWKRWAKSLSEDGNGSDVCAIRDGYISITPIHSRLTETAMIPVMEEWQLG